MTLIQQKIIIEDQVLAFGYVFFANNPNMISRTPLPITDDPSESGFTKAVGVANYRSVNY